MMSQVLLNALADPNYRPYCLRCTRLRRMDKVADFCWRCPCCASVHDERANLQADDESIQNTLTALPNEDAANVARLNRWLASFKVGIRLPLDREG